MKTTKDMLQNPIVKLLIGIVTIAILIALLPSFLKLVIKQMGNSFDFRSDEEKKEDEEKQELVEAQNKEAYAKGAKKQDYKKMADMIEEACQGWTTDFERIKNIFKQLSSAECTLLHNAFGERKMINWSYGISKFNMAQMLKEELTEEQWKWVKQWVSKSTVANVYK